MYSVCLRIIDFDQWSKMFWLMVIDSLIGGREDLKSSVGTFAFCASSVKCESIPKPVNLPESDPLSSNETVPELEIIKVPVAIVFSSSTMYCRITRVLTIVRCMYVLNPKCGSYVIFFYNLKAPFLTIYF